MKKYVVCLIELTQISRGNELIASTLGWLVPGNTLVIPTPAHERVMLMLVQRPVVIAVAVIVLAVHRHQTTR